MLERGNAGESECWRGVKKKRVNEGETECCYKEGMLERVMLETEECGCVLERVHAEERLYAR